MNSFAPSESSKHFKQTSHFAREASPISNANKENEQLNTSSSVQFKSFNDPLNLLNELSENVKLDESIIEEHLSLYEKITHQKWQIRRKTFMELRDQNDDFQPAWLRNVVNECNQFAYYEGLRFVDYFTQSENVTK